jgi:eukaryotic-like serine/threonine-protein kinase
VWTRSLDDPGTGAGPVVHDDTVIAITNEKVAALSFDDGEVRWELARESGPAGPAAIDGDLVVYAEGKGEDSAVAAVSLQAGEERWRLDTDSPVVGGVTVSDRVAFIGARDGSVRAIELDSGRERWSFKASGRVETPPAVAGGLVLVVAEALKSGRASAHALNASTGDEEWSFSPERIALGASPVTANDDVAVFGLGDLSVYAFELDSGVERWSVRSRAPFSARMLPAFPDDVLIGDRGGHLYRLDGSSGEERWVFRVPGSLLTGSAVVAGSFVVVGDRSGQVSAIDLDSGRLVWKEKAEGGVLGIAAAGDRVFASSADGSVQAFEHDPQATLLDEPSPTTLFVGRALLNFLAAFAPLTFGLLLLFRWVERRPGRRFSEDPSTGGGT